MLGAPTPSSQWVVLQRPLDPIAAGHRIMQARQKICQAVGRMIVAFELLCVYDAWPTQTEGTVKEIVDAALDACCLAARNKGKFGPLSFEVIMKVAIEAYDKLLGLKDDIPYIILT